MTSSLFSLEGKVAVVTGALGLLGREHCLALKEAGATVIVTDLDEGLCKSFASELGQGAMGVGLRVQDENSVSGALHEILAVHNRVDILVNNAAIDEKFQVGKYKPEQTRPENLSLTTWREMIDVNITGLFICARTFGTQMATQRSGSIINIGSTYGLVGPDQKIYQDESGEQLFYKSPCYPTTKAAVLSMTRSLATYWGEKNVRVNALCPGGVENSQAPIFVKRYSERTPLGRMAKKEEFRGAIIFLASDASSYMTGATLVVDGGWTAW